MKIYLLSNLLQQMRKAICIIFNNVLLDAKVKGWLPERKGKNVRKKRDGQLIQPFYPLFFKRSFHLVKRYIGTKNVSLRLCPIYIFKYQNYRLHTAIFLLFSHSGFSLAPVVFH